MTYYERHPEEKTLGPKKSKKLAVDIITILIGSTIFLLISIKVLGIEF